MRSIYKIYFIIILFSLAALSCGAGARRAKPGAGADQRTLAEAKFDPLDDEGDEDVITLDVPAARESDSAGDIFSLPQRPETVKEDDQYFSVQLFASKSNTETKEFKNSISSLFGDDVRIDYQAPYYRVCIGKVAGFDQGEVLLKRVNDMGFPKAWLVRVRK